MTSPTPYLSMPPEGELVVEGPPPALQLRVFIHDRLIAEDIVLTHGLGVVQVQKIQREHTARVKGFIREGKLDDDVFTPNPNSPTVVITQFGGRP
jgi:hypothetical protein